MWRTFAFIRIGTTIHTASVYRADTEQICRVSHQIFPLACRGEGLWLGKTERSHAMGHRLSPKYSKMKSVCCASSREIAPPRAIQDGIYLRSPRDRKRMRIGTGRKRSDCLIEDLMRAVATGDLSANFEYARQIDESSYPEGANSSALVCCALVRGPRGGWRWY